MRLINQTAHRPYPLPQGPWVMFQRWHELLFAHWPIEPEALRGAIPSHLPLDTFEGKAWVGVVPFRMSGVRPRGLPPVPGLSAFPELNVRTYVTVDGKPGVLFFSLDASNPMAVWAARRWFHLPYVHANMSIRGNSDWVNYHSVRTDSGAPPGTFIGSYRPISPVFTAKPGSLDHWLTERYCLYTTDAHGHLYRGEIHHRPWPLQRAEARIEVNTMGTANGLELPPVEPVLHYADRLDVVVWPLHRVQA